MIQEITPHVFHNEFGKKKPSPDSFFLYFKDRSVLLHTGQSQSLLRFSDLECQRSEAVQNSTYLFSIDDMNFYLTDSTAVHLPETGVMSFYDLDAVRDLEPMWVSFAASTAHQLYRFYRDNRYCGRCGTPMDKSLKERAMVCPACGNINYPKIAPAVIVAVTHQNKLLLTKYAGRHYKRYALVAGYTEFGETLEETVRREVMEEVGLTVKNVRYYKNQPWAFSDSLLVGYFAELDGSPQIRLDETELSTAIWVDRQEISDDYTNVSLTHEMILLFKNGQSNS